MIPESFTREGFVSYMESMTRWAARRFMRLHPILAKKDLEQEAVIPLLLVYDKEHKRKPPIELCNLGRVAVLRHLQMMHRHAFSYGEFTTPVLDLDQPITEDGKPLADIIGTAGLEDIFFWFALDELERMLGDLERKVLSELLVPSERTLKAAKAVYDARRHNAKSGNKSQGNYIQRDRLHSLSSSLNTPIYRIRHALGNIQRTTLKIFANDLPSAQYKVVSPATPPHFPFNLTPEGERGMVTTGNTKGVIPDEATDPLLNEFSKPPSEAAAAQKAAKEKKAKTAPATGKAATKPKAKASGKKAAVKGTKEKPAKESKGPRSARGPRVFDPQKPFRNGSNADTAWQHLMSVFAKGGKDRVVTAEDATKGFEKVGKKDADAAKAGSYFLYWLAKHKLLVRTDRGAYALPKK